MEVKLHAILILAFDGTEFSLGNIPRCIMDKRPCEVKPFDRQCSKEMDDNTALRRIYDAL
jgi:hypothetical protein